MTYQPKPLDTSNVVLPPELTRLREVLAENTHENWSAQRIKDGWTYGPKRDDALKQHPSLVPYKDLSESEKEYDRVTSEQVLKAIIASGFEIRPVVGRIEPVSSSGSDWPRF